MAESPDDGAVILYDGICVLCSSGIRFVAKRDVDRIFRFTSIQSTYGRALALRLGIDPNAPETFALVMGGRPYLSSDAVLAISARLPGWRWTKALRIVPRGLRDALYGFVARHRYRMFGRTEVCDIPGPELRSRVIE